MMIYQDLLLAGMANCGLPAAILNYSRFTIVTIELDSSLVDSCYSFCCWLPLIIIISTT